MFDPDPDNLLPRFAKKNIPTVEIELNEDFTIMKG